MNNKLRLFLGSILLLFFFNLSIKAQVTFEKEVKITDIALHFDGGQVDSEDAPNSATGYDYAFGPQISAHGDCITTYKQYVFMTWYKGGKENRHMMLTRYNTETGTEKTIEFPHQHTGWRNIWYIGESHNTIGVGVSPLDGTIHLLFDMHAYTRNRPTDGSLANDYFRYSFTSKNAAEVSDEDFNLDLFVKDANDDYTHLSLNGTEDYTAFSEFTYPKFFLNNQGDLFFSMRKGASPNGGYHFAKYDANTSTWSDFVKFADKNAKNFGEPYNWGMYGRLQYVGGKIGIGFQRRLQNTNDRYLYQNGFYYAYSDDQSGQTDWKNYKGEGFSTPLRDADKILAYEPGDLIETTQKDQVYMVGGFDWTVTDRGDIHIIGRVQDNENNVTKNVHTYKKAGETEFTTSTDFTGGDRLFTSGNNIYMIGLNSSGRIFIEQSLGGTNNFRKVYEATTGKQFRHGRAYISNGKLYYYMMEQASGDQRRLYLQIIDLNIDNSPFQVSLISPSNNESYEANKPIEISAEAFNDNGSISRVEFIINNQVFEEDSTSPYTVNYTPETEGTYTIKAIAYDQNNGSVSSEEINIEVFTRSANDLSGDIYRLKNVATGKYLASSSSSIIASDSNEGSDKEWQLVKAEVPGFDYYNIDSEVRGIIRFTGGANNPGLVSTNFGSPNTNVDKIWRVIANNDGSFSFATRTSDRFLYQTADGTMTHSANTDNRSKWLAESITLSIEDVSNSITSIITYPNPTKDNFTIQLNNIDNASISIYDVLGKKIYQKMNVREKVEVANQNRFKSGIYLIKVIDNNQKIYHNKLIIN